jgi:hypothetical protein
MAKISTISRASGDITSGVITDTETFTIAGKVYTCRATVGALDGSVHIGSDDDATLLNLTNAINNTGGGVPDVDYGAGMTTHPHVTASTGDGSVVAITAIVPGVGPGLYTIATTSDAVVDATLGAGTAGVGSVTTAVNEILSTMQLNSEVIAALDQLDESANAGV